MMQFARSLARIALAGLILFAAQSLVTADRAGAQDSSFKYVYAIDYPLGQKAAYLEWVGTVADILQGPEELEGITSYDNYFGVSPHRFIEFEFENLEAAGRYFERPEIAGVLEEVVDRGINASVTVLRQRSDYSEQAGEGMTLGTVKYVYALDYPLAQKEAYLEWVRSIVDTLQAPEEVKRIASYDNYFGASPHRFIEFEFDDLQAAARYFERAEINNVLEDVVNHSINASITVLELRGDYTKQ